LAPACHTQAGMMVRALQACCTDGLQPPGNNGIGC